MHEATQSPATGQPQTYCGSSGALPGMIFSLSPGKGWPGAEASLQVSLCSHSQNSRLPKTKLGPHPHRLSFENWFPRSHEGKNQMRPQSELSVQKKIFKLSLRNSTTTLRNFLQQRMPLARMGVATDDGTNSIFLDYQRGVAYSSQKLNIFIVPMEVFT